MPGDLLNQYVVEGIRRVSGLVVVRFTKFRSERPREDKDFCGLEGHMAAPGNQ